MRYFVTTQTVILDPSLAAKARRFANQVIATVGTPGSGYPDCHQLNLAKIATDHFIGKLGEEAVRVVFEQLNRQVRGPDYQIYQGRQKSWQADLYVDGAGLAVKTQSFASAQRFGLSWTFQAGASRTDPILHHPEAWVCFVTVNDTTYHCQVYPPYQIKELKFEAPKLQHLKASKKVVYAANLTLL